MYIFSRRRLINPGRFGQALADGTAIAGRVTELTDVPVMAWMSQYDPEGSAMVWSARFETLTDLDDAFGRMMESDAYQAEAEALDPLFSGQAVDNLIQIVAGSLGDGPAPLVSVIQATAAAGQNQAAMAWGADVATKVSESLGVPIAFGIGVYGVYGSMGWITSYEDVAQIDEARGKLLADTALQTAIDEGGYTVQQSATNVLLRRLN